MQTVEDSGPPQFTYAMMAVYVAVFISQWTGADLAVLHSFPWRLGDGELWRLVTSTTMHGGVIHLLFNMAWFRQFGAVIEFWIGPWLTMLLYLALAAGSAAAQSVFASPEGVPAIGASGVVYGFFGFLWVVRRRYTFAAEAVTPHVVQIMLAWLAVCAVVNFFGGHIANTAHVVGLLLGWLAGKAVVAKRQWRWPIAGGAAVLCAALVVLPWEPAWNATLARVPVVRNRYEPEMVGVIRRQLWVNRSVAERRAMYELWREDLLRYQREQEEAYGTQRPGNLL